MASAARPARTWVVTTVGNPVRTDEVDHLARSAEGGLSYQTGEGLPEYLGVWLDPNGENTWHLYSDYPPEHHRRFGWSHRCLCAWLGVGTPSHEVSPFCQPEGDTAPLLSSEADRD